jgi:hypothetical protein
MIAISGNAWTMARRAGGLDAHPRGMLFGTAPAEDEKRVRPAPEG